jgi:hypothetical protein
VNLQTQGNTTNYVPAILKDIKPSRFEHSDTANYFVTAEESFLLPEGCIQKTKALYCHTAHSACDQSSILTA